MTVETVDGPLEISIVSWHRQLAEMIRDELESGGFERSRLFKSRVLVELRCPGNPRHLLGAVYPTRMGPLLAGVVARPPRPYTRADREKIQQRFAGFEMDFHQERDRYEVDYSTPDHDYVQKPPVVLMDWPHDPQIDWYWDLWCRCGRVAVFFDDLWEALDQQAASGKRTVFVPQS
ncbi:hypothetical protein [Frankia tisae]|uniref:hypothetical protein n=1 Tax=Frankia tisae TaxID=2950104 RepID=UPI0021C059C1|nr:hypothetical protein [Frankia tisae]